MASVPIRSQVWAKLVWAGHGDHLDVLGLFRDRASAGVPGVDGAPPPHVDWLCSESGFDRERFSPLMDAIAGGLVSSGRLQV